MQINYMQKQNLIIKSKLNVLREKYYVQQGLSSITISQVLLYANDTFCAYQKNFNFITIELRFVIIKINHQVILPLHLILSSRLLCAIRLRKRIEDKVLIQSLFGLSTSFSVNHRRRSKSLQHKMCVCTHVTSVLFFFFFLLLLMSALTYTGDTWLIDPFSTYIVSFDDTTLNYTMMFFNFFFFSV